jgi:hypothetical protein
MRRLIPQVLILLVLIQLSPAAEKRDVLPLLPAAELSANAKETTDPAGQPAVQVLGGSEKSRTTVVNCPAPQISSDDYVVRGEVKYEGVAGEGYMELLNDFGSKRVYFTRSLADFGSMRKLKGTSGWRKFELPFHAEPGMRPEKLTLNVVLPGSGTVVVAQPTFATIDISNQWWTEQQSGLYGGIFGSLLGIMGAIIGCLAGLRKAKQVTFALFGLSIAIGVIALIVGLIAVLCDQPWHVYYPLLLVGIIDVAVLGGNLWSLLRRYRADELRQIAAADA